MQTRKTFVSLVKDVGSVTHSSWSSVLSEGNPIHVDTGISSAREGYFVVPSFQYITRGSKDLSMTILVENDGVSLRCVAASGLVSVGPDYEHRTTNINRFLP